MNSPQRTGRWLHWWMLGYILLLGAVIGAMYWARNAATSGLSSQASISDWQTYRNDVRKKQPNLGPVERPVPASKEPPGLVLMRDFFTVMMAGAVVFSSMLYWIIAWFVTGILQSR